MKILLLKFCCIATTLILFSNCTNKTATKAESNKQEFEWLVGEWHAQRPGGMIKESWTLFNDSTLNGASFLQKKDSADILLETMLFEKSGESYTLTVTAADAIDKPVAFKLTSKNDTVFIVENKTHDFPKRIIYRLMNKDSMHASIDDGKDITDMKQDYYFSRKNVLNGIQ